MEDANIMVRMVKEYGDGGSYYNITIMEDANITIMEDANIIIILIITGRVI